jgi:hypothetical protein
MKTRMFRTEPKQVAVIGRHFAQSAPVTFGVRFAEKNMEGAQSCPLHLKGTPQFTYAPKVPLFIFVIQRAARPRSTG